MVRIVLVMVMRVVNDILAVLKDSSGMEELPSI